MEDPMSFEIVQLVQYAACHYNKASRLALKQQTLSRQK
jgi:hypothetical protein